MAPRPLRVCYFGTYRAEYSRNQIMLAGLRQAGAEVIECHAALWTSIEDRVQVTRGGWAHPRFWWRVLSAYGRLLQQYRSAGAYDVLMVGYPGQFDVFLARLLAWLRRRPLVWDVFMSIYLIAVERQLDQGHAGTVGLLKFIEGAGLRLPDRLVADTAEYVAWYGHTHGLRPERFRLVPTGADDRRFQPQAAPEGTAASPLRVTYFGTFIPNHGVSYILEAARCLSGQSDIQFELIGDGPERAMAEALAQRYALANVVFSPWLEPDELARHVGKCQVVLGAFGHTPQSMMTVQNKIYEGLALARAVVTGDSPAVRAALAAGEEVWLVDRAEPASLARALSELAVNPALCARLAAAGHQRFCADYNVAAIGRTTLAILTELATPGSGHAPAAARAG